MKKSHLILAVLCCLFASACSTMVSVGKKPLEIKPLHIVFVPGFKGSVLKATDSDEVIWLTASGALLGDDTLARSDSGLNIAGEQSLEVSGVLKNIGVLPWLYSVDAYGSILDWLNSEFPDASVTPLAYYWRDSVATAAAKLKAEVLRARALGAARVVIVAHSMGGLVTSYYLRYGDQPYQTELDKAAVETWEGAEQVDAVAIAGTPFHGVLSIFHDMQRGIKTGLNRSLLSAQALQTFPSSYELLPSYSDAVLDRDSKKPLDGVVSNSKLFSRCRFGLFASELTEAERSKRQSFVDSAMKNANHFSELLHKPLVAAPAKRIPLLLLAGVGHKTHSHSLWLPAKHGGCGKFAFFEDELSEIFTDKARELIYREGDGLVTRLAQEPPPAYTKAFALSLQEVAAKHGSIYNHIEAKNALRELLQGSEISD